MTIVDYRMKADTGHFKVTGHEVKLVRSSITKALQKNWWLVIVYIAVTIAGLGYTYATGTWRDVFVAFFVAAITFAVGLKMLIEVNTITTEIH